MLTGNWYFSATISALCIFRKFTCHFPVGVCESEQETEPLLWELQFLPSVSGFSFDSQGALLKKSHVVPVTNPFPVASVLGMFSGCTYACDSNRSLCPKFVNKAVRSFFSIN